MSVIVDMASCPYGQGEQKEEHVGVATRQCQVVRVDKYIAVRRVSHGGHTQCLRCPLSSEVAASVLCPTRQSGFSQNSI
jgi:hypothetical protein